MANCLHKNQNLLLLIPAAALLLSACNPGAYNRTLTSQINTLKQEIQKLQEENRMLALKLAEIQKRYGIPIHQLTPETKFKHDIFDRVFSDTTIPQISTP